MGVQTRSPGGIGVQTRTLEGWGNVVNYILYKPGIVTGELQARTQGGAGGNVVLSEPC